MQQYPSAGATSGLEGKAAQALCNVWCIPGGLPGSLFPSTCHTAGCPWGFLLELELTLFPQGGVHVPV